MDIKLFARHLKMAGIKEVYGIPDSAIKQFCEYMNTDGIKDFTHLVPPDEGGAVALAAGSYLTTKRPACIYMQNSGIGNIVNPLTSLANEEVYGIPMLFIVGYRGEPGVHDEPQHVFMGAITESILDTLHVSSRVIGRDTTEEELSEIFSEVKDAFLVNRQYAIIIKRDTFDNSQNIKFSNGYTYIREDAIKTILNHVSDKDIIVSTTGKISREVYEQCDNIFGHHNMCFLTVGGMGYASMIAYGMAVQNPSKKVFCIDGDGAALMHMGNLAFIGSNPVNNLIHICLNNEAHESVGGMPTGAAGTKYGIIAADCRYGVTYEAYNEKELSEALVMADKFICEEQKGPVFIEIFVASGSRKDLGRPVESAACNKINFMKYHEV